MCVFEAEVVLAIFAGDKLHSSFAFRFELLQLAATRSCHVKIHICTISPGKHVEKGQYLVPCDCGCMAHIAISIGESEKDKEKQKSAGSSSGHTLMSYFMKAKRLLRSYLEVEAMGRPAAYHKKYGTKR